MSRKLKPNELSDSLGQILTVYASEVTDQINAVGEQSIQALVAETKRTANRLTGDYRKAITYARIKRLFGDTFVWYAKGKKGRLTHLLAHGHALRNGGRVAGNPFLQNALARILPSYLAKIQEVLKGD